MAGSCTLREEQGERSLCPTAGIEIPQGAVKTAGQGFFLGGSVVKTLLTNARNAGLTPWPRRSPRAVEQLSACATAKRLRHSHCACATAIAPAPQPLRLRRSYCACALAPSTRSSRVHRAATTEARICRACAPHPEKLLLATTREKSMRAVTKTQHSPRNALKKEERLMDKGK